MNKAKLRVPISFLGLTLSLGFPSRQFNIEIKTDCNRGLEYTLVCLSDSVSWGESDSVVKGVAFRIRGLPAETTVRLLLSFVSLGLYL